MNTITHNWIVTHSGRKFNLQHPEPAMICLEDIAEALSKLCRFCGHTRFFYSVAQHSVLVSRLVAKDHPELAFLALMHDATEAYLGDVSRPLKHLLPDYQRLESGVWVAIAGKFHIPYVVPEVVKYFDTVMLMTERRDLLGAQPGPWHPSLEAVPPDAEQINPMFWIGARDQFLAEAERLQR